MDACYGPCCLDVDPTAYRRVVDEVRLFLKGRTPELIEKLRRRMQAAVDKLAFEEAARLRDRIHAMEVTLERQQAVASDRRDRDVMVIASEDNLAVIHVLSVRGGYLQGSRSYRTAPNLADEAEMLSAFIRQFYPPGSQCPQEILTAPVPDDAPLLVEWLRSAHAHTVKIIRPLRGEKKRLLEMGRINAQKSLREYLAEENRRERVLERLGRRLGLAVRPRRIECFDNSNLFGKAAVAGMVVFEDGRPQQSQYRKFALRKSLKPDDYGAMEEVLSRRFINHPGWPRPDLLLVDGGKGQLNIALDVMGKIGLDGAFALAAIAKKESGRGDSQDKIYIPRRANPVQFSGDDEALLLLQRIRDEAHRFAVQYHRRMRHKETLQSAFDGIPGIGPKRKKILLRHFGSLEAVRAATLEELRALPGMNRQAAEAIQRRLLQNEGPKG
jgi:excinuclease ABC subunit C